MKKYNNFQKIAKTNLEKRSFMKKILPILSIVGASSLIVCFSTDINAKNNNFINNLQAFQEDVKDYTALNEKGLTKTALNKYQITIESDNLQELTNEKDDNKVSNSINTSNEITTNIGTQSYWMNVLL